jgi:colanic acid/amylovoran biosynthesis glycosyltransferase
MNETKIAFFTPNLNQVSETFIRNQIDKLSPRLVFSGGWFPNKCNNKRIVRIRHRIYFFYLNEKEIRIKLAKKTIIESNINVIIIQYFQTWLENYKWIVKLKIPVIVHFHGFDFSCYEFLNHPLKFEALNLIQGAISVSHSMTYRLVDSGLANDIVITQPCPPNGDLVRVTLNELLANKSNLLENKKIKIVLLGRFTSKKSPLINVFLIHRIIHLMNKEIVGCPFEFHWVGGGEYFELCRILSKQLKIDNHIIFHGPLEHKDSMRILSAGQIFIQNSITADDGNKEGTPVALLEAGMFGLAVVGTNHEGIMDVIQNNVNGFLADEGDIEKLAQQTCELIISPNKRIEFGNQLKLKVIKEYNEKIYYHKITKLIDKITHGN